MLHESGVTVSLELSKSWVAILSATKSDPQEEQGIAASSSSSSSSNKLMTIDQLTSTVEVAERQGYNVGVNVVEKSVGWKSG